MALDFTRENGAPIGKQTFMWRGKIGEPIRELDHDAFEPVRGWVLAQARFDAHHRPTEGVAGVTAR